MIVSELSGMIDVKSLEQYVPSKLSTVTVPTTPVKTNIVQATGWQESWYLSCARLLPHTFLFSLFILTTVVL